jgi:hypothetical protein
MDRLRYDLAQGKPNESDSRKKGLSYDRIIESLSQKLKEIVYLFLWQNDWVSRCHVSK